MMRYLWWPTALNYRTKNKRTEGDKAIAKQPKRLFASMIGPITDLFVHPSFI